MQNQFCPGWNVRHAAFRHTHRHTHMHEHTHIHACTFLLSIQPPLPLLFFISHPSFVFVFVFLSFFSTFFSLCVSRTRPVFVTLYFVYSTIQHSCLLSPPLHDLTKQYSRYPDLTAKLFFSIVFRVDYTNKQLLCGVVFVKQIPHLCIIHKLA